MRPQIPKASIALIITSALLATWSGREMVRDPMPAGLFAPRDAADIGKECFEGLRPALKNIRFAGYVASRPATNPNDMGALFLAQYFLAPTVLSPGRVGQVIVANLDTQSELDALIADGNYEVVASLHPGVAVLRPRSTP